MPIERFIWTLHARDRCGSRLVERRAVERAIRLGHDERQINRGEADWRVYGLLADGRRIVVIYDYPHQDKRGVVMVVSVWEL